MAIAVVQLTPSHQVFGQVAALFDDYRARSIRDLYVAPQQRRSGIAHALLQHVAGEARVAGASRVSVQTEAGNGPALRLYTATGFQPERSGAGGPRG